MSDTWFRGESTNASPASLGGHIHDFGDGVYFTNSKPVAKLYAQTRVRESGGDPRVYHVETSRPDLGRVLDLTNDPRWQTFLRTPQIPGRLETTPETLIRQANENYGRFFQAFLGQHQLRLQDYDAVIGPEFVRGGRQLGIVHRDGRASPIAVQVLARMLPVGPGQSGGSSPAVPPPRSTPPLSGGGFRSAGRGVVSNHAAMAIVGQALGAGLQALGDVGIQRRIRQELATAHAQSITNILNHGEGVLVMIVLQEWERPDGNGMRARGLLSVLVTGGPTQQEALARWRHTPQLLQGPPRGWRVRTEYSWIPPQ